MLVEVESECGHCGQPIHLELDHELRYRVRDGEDSPVVFYPQVDWSRYDQPHILDGF